MENTARENRIAVNSVMQVFSKPLTSFKLKEEFQALARALDISTLGTRDEILARIKQHLEDHPELAENTRFEGLFLQRNRRNQAAQNVNITAQVPIESTSESSQPTNEAEIHTTHNMNLYNNSINHPEYSAALPQSRAAGNYPSHGNPTTLYSHLYNYSLPSNSSSNFYNPHLNHSHQPFY